MDVLKVSLKSRKLVERALFCYGLRNFPIKVKNY